MCGYCGAALAPTSPARGTRKTVTILFTDVSGSTALGRKPSSATWVETRKTSPFWTLATMCRPSRRANVRVAKESSPGTRSEAPLAAAVPLPTARGDASRLRHRPRHPTRYEHLEAIPERASQWDVAVRGALTLAANLRDHRDDAFLFRELATLRADAPVPESLDDLRWRGVPRQPFEALIALTGADHLRGRVPRWAD